MYKACVEEKLYEICARFETSLIKKLDPPSQKTVVSASSARNATKVPHLYRWKETVIQKPHNTDHEARVNFANWYLHGAHGRSHIYAV